MRTFYLLALLPFLLSASCVYTLPVDELAVPDDELDFANADEAEDYGANDYSFGLDGDENANDDDLRGGRRLRQAVKSIFHRHHTAKPTSSQERRRFQPITFATHKIIKLPQTPVARRAFSVGEREKADKVAHYISLLNTDIDRNHEAFMTRYNAQLAELKAISKRKLYTEEQYLNAQRELNAKYKAWRDTLHAFSISNSTLHSLRLHNSTFVEEKNLLTHLYEYVKMFSTKEGYYKHNCVCNATIVN